jgi:WD40 repeat protein
MMPIKVNTTSPNGQFVASRCGSRIVVWGGDEQPIHVLDAGIQSPVDLVAWVADGGKIVAGYRNGVVQGWNVLTGEVLFNCFPDQPAVSVQCIAVAPNGERVATLDANNRICVWDLSKGQIVARFGAAFATLSLEWSPDAQVLYTDSGPVWLAEGSCVLSLLYQMISSLYL